MILGRQVLQRGIVFIDLAIAQVASLGVVISHVVSDGSVEVSLFIKLLPFIFSLVTSLFIASLANSLVHELEAIIGCIYVVSAAAGSNSQPLWRRTGSALSCRANILG